MRLLRIVITFFVLLAVVFATIFVIANWQAISTKVSYWWDARTGRGVYGQTELDGFGANTEITPQDDRLIIPTLAINAPLLFPDDADDATLLSALQDGVVSYPGSAGPGQPGNFFVTGHSSQLAWEQGNYKSVFSLLEHISPGDVVLVYYRQQKYVYIVETSTIVAPTETSVLDDSEDARLTLMTCWPTGTTARRLVVSATLQGPPEVSKAQESLRRDNSRDDGDRDEYTPSTLPLVR
ncbi:MAG: sortase [bacterium]|nr:sortase [bacterium]